MKQALTSTALFITFLLVTASLQAQFTYQDTYKWDGVPTHLVTSDTDCNAAFIAKIGLTLPERRPVPIYNPRLLADGRPETITLSADADVWITFIDEGASYRNALGYYTYKTGTPPATAPAEKDITIIFPNASKPGAGGGLNTGSKVYLGKFSANTSIAFALIVDGWNDVNVNNKKGILYANAAFNPEKADSLKKHTVLLNDDKTGKLIIGFEDTRRDDAHCDNDFNDVLFYATVNARSSVAHNDSIPNLVADGNVVYSGNSGGLESKSLGDIIGKRMLNKYKTVGNMAVNYSFMPKLINNSKYSTLGVTTPVSINNITISSIMPERVYDSGYTAYVTSPTDITSFTNATDVNSIDFVKGSSCKAVAFATKSIGAVYAHTKPVCDRLRGSQILSVENFTLQNLTFVRYAVKRSSGNIEYATSFSIGTAAGRNSFSFQSNWLTKDYENDEAMYNYQLWASAPYLVTDMMIEVLNKLNAIAPVKTMATPSVLPAAYIKAAQRNNGNLQLIINNASAVTSGSFEIDEKANEYADIKTKVYPFTMTANGVSVININANDIYEHNIRMVINGKTQDLLYMSDGNWAIDYDRNATSVSSFTVSNATADSYTTDLPLYRNIHVEATTATYVSLYKLLKGGGATQDLSGYKTLNFSASGGNNLRITVLKNSIANWNDQYTISIPLAVESKDYSISLADLKSALNEASMDLSDVTTVIFSVEIPSGATTAINANFSNIGFSKTEKAIITAQPTTTSQEVQVYPNPSNGRFTLTFQSDSQRAYTLRITDISTGRTISTKVITAIKGSNLVSVDIANQITAGSICVLSMADGEGSFNFTNKKILFRK